jgi:hypothetical protein
MLYKFKSKAAGDVIMLGQTGDEILRVIGKEPASKGIIPVSAMQDAVSALEVAIQADEAARAKARSEAATDGQSRPRDEGVSLRQRAWPLVEMMRRSSSENADIVWGV